MLRGGSGLSRNTTLDGTGPQCRSCNGSSCVQRQHLHDQRALNGWCTGPNNNSLPRYVTLNRMEQTETRCNHSRLVTNTIPNTDKCQNTDKYQNTETSPRSSTDALLIPAPEYWASSIHYRSPPPTHPRPLTALLPLRTLTPRSLLSARAGRGAGHQPHCDRHLPLAVPGRRAVVQQSLQRRRRGHNVKLLPGREQRHVRVGAHWKRRRAGWLSALAVAHHRRCGVPAGAL